MGLPSCPRTAGFGGHPDHKRERALSRRRETGRRTPYANIPLGWACGRRSRDRSNGKAGKGILPGPNRIRLPDGPAA